jgi:hypothetical protein
MVWLTAALVVLGGCLARAGETDFMTGGGLAHLRRPPRIGTGSVELNHWTDDSWLGFWTTYDFSPGGAYVGLGPMARVRLGSDWILAGGSGPGYGDDKIAVNLGDRLEFRSTIYLFQELGDGVRWGISFGHYSNAGLARHNPGAEYVHFLLSVPLGN